MLQRNDDFLNTFTPLPGRCAARLWTAVAIRDDRADEFFAPRQLRRKEPPCDMPTPYADKARAPCGFGPTLPYLRRRVAAQMLMRPRRVVPRSEFHQLHPQVVAINNHHAVELCLNVPKKRSTRPFCHGQ